MAGKKGIGPLFVFGLIIFVVLIISGILTALVDMILVALFLSYGDAEIMVIPIVISIVIAIFILGIVFRMAGFRRK